MKLKFKTSIKTPLNKLPRFSDIKKLKINNGWFDTFYRDLPKNMIYCVAYHKNKPISIIAIDTLKKTHFVMGYTKPNYRGKSIQTRCLNHLIGYYPQIKTQKIQCYNVAMIITCIKCNLNINKKLLDVDINDYYYNR